MPFIQERQPAPQATPTRAFVTTTTTIRASPTPGPTQKPSPSIPVGAIAGGVAGGALLAILVTFGWVCWGKSIKRSQAKQIKEAESLRKTRHNTHHNAVASRPRVLGYRPLYAPPLDKKVTFAGPDEPKFDTWHLDAPSKSVFPGRHFTTQFMPAHLKPSKPRPLRSVKGSPHLGALAADQVPPLPQMLPPPKQRIVHKPSDISSASVYSTASGEERVARGVPANLILAALGGLGGGGDRSSGVSSRWSLISRWTQGVQGAGGGENRQSQTSNSSVYPASVDSSGVPIGVAY